MATLIEAKQRLDRIMKIARVSWYKPIQVAEILHHHRIEPTFDLFNLAAYRNASKCWRDDISQCLVGGISTSSQKYQDNLFEENAIPVEYIALLSRANEGDQPGVVEAYIYASLSVRLSLLGDLAQYLSSATTQSFILKRFVEAFQTSPGLKRSIDKVYEIVVYALFDTLVRHLEATVTLSVAHSERELLREFEDFTRIVLGLTVEKMEITKPAQLYRVGVANAADRGLDMWANFGPAIQVKHVTLNEELASDISDEVAENAQVVIVCHTAERVLIERVLTQVGLSNRIQGVVTLADLERWYSKCLEARFASSLGEDLLDNLRTQFELEFPSTGSALSNLQAERKYDKIKLTGFWQLP